MAAWKTLLEYVRTLSEDRKYRGSTDVRLKDLQKLGDEIGVRIDPNGGTLKTEYDFDPSIWGSNPGSSGWQDKPGAALAVASTDSKRSVQSGNAQGGVVAKTNWGGRVVNQPAPIRQSSNSHLGSSMDRYDVMMIADIGTRTTAKGKTVPMATLTRFCWSPAMGSADERRARLEDLMAGKMVAPPRRPQGDMPTVSRDDEERWNAQAIARDKAASADSDSKVAGDMSGGSVSNTSWKDKLAKHNAQYQPSVKQDRSAPDDDDPDRIFPGLKRR